MNGSYRKNVAMRRCLPSNLVPRQAVALPKSAISMPLST